MRYDVPVFAYAAAAVPETLRYSGVLFLTKSGQRLRKQLVSCFQTNNYAHR